MNTTHKLDEMATPEMTAKAWDDYLHRCGARAYISTPVPGSSVRDATLSPSSATRHSVRVRGRLDRAAADQSRPVRAGMAQAAWSTETDIRGCHIPSMQWPVRATQARPAVHEPA